MSSIPEGSRYQLDARIATGGMGEVWRGTDTLLDREVAVKVLKHEYADDPTFRSRFEAEARNAGALHHPHVASIFDFGELPADDGSGTARPFLVMELVPGQPLSTLLRPGEPMSPSAAAALLAQAADAIAAAHAIGIVHRDVKPANLLVTPEGELKITDFGIARAADGMALTQTGQIVGTPHYISPEQAEGRPATEASDIYALGVVLYECLAGRRPFSGDTPVTAALAHLREEVPPLPDEVPEHLRLVVTKALAKDPAARFSTAADLAAALRGRPVQEPVPPAASTLVDAEPPAPEPVAAPIAGAGAATAAAAGAAAGGFRDASAPQPAGAGIAAQPAGAGIAAQPAGAGPGADETQVLSTAPPRRTAVAAIAGAPRWLLATAAVAALVLVVAMVSAIAGGDPASTAADAPADATTGPSASPSASADPRVRVRAARYIGMEHKRARAALEGLGLTVRESTRNNPGDKRAGTVAGLTPTGLVEPGTTVTLRVWGAPPAPAPAPPKSKPHHGDHGDHGHGHGKAKGKKD